MGFADFPFQSRYREIRGHRIHYVDEGQGPTLLFLHGNPTSSYLWRNIIKPLSRDYRCIAPDLIGFGKSDKPDLDYRFDTHYRFIEEFILDLGLNELTLVLHDWGGPLGFRFAREHPERVSGICFMETFPFTLRLDELPAMARPLFRAFRRPITGQFLIMWQNLFVNLVLPLSVKRHLPHSVMSVYRAPFRRLRDRFPVYVWPNELPLDDCKGDTWERIHDIEQGLADMPQRMLLLAFRPGAILRRERVAWLQRKLPDLQVVDCGHGLHFVQEDQPESIAANLSAWLQDKTSPGRPQKKASAAARTPTIPAIHEDERYRGQLSWRILNHNGEDMLAVWSNEGLVMLQFLEPAEDPETLVRKSFPDATATPAAGDKTDWLSVASPLHLVGTDFQRRVWKALMQIPPGTTRTYKQLADELGSQPRAVGQAVARNALALRIPCHRVVPVSGGPGEYRWGKARKAELLQREAAD